MLDLTYPHSHWQPDNMSQSEITQIMAETLLPKHLTDPLVVRFIGNYVQCKDVKQAADLTGITGADGRNLFNRPDIYKCIAKITEKVVAKFGFDAEQVVERVKELAFVDIADLFDEKGRIIENIHQIDPAVRRAVKKFKYKSYFEDDINGVPQYRGRIYEVELWDKPRSLELLGREKDTFKKTTVMQHDVSKNAAEFLLGSIQRADEHKRQIEAPKDVTPVIDVAPVMGFTKPPGVK